jgi:divalent metal cation (Fe/Co/Zn/Cd) transporter
VLAGTVVVWLFTGRRLHSEHAERRAQQLIALSFFLLAAYVAIASLRTLTGPDHPRESWVGIGLALVTAPTMPLLARAKRRVGRQLGSRATESEGQQNMICATCPSPCSSALAQMRCSAGGGRTRLPRW